MSQNRSQHAPSSAPDNPGTLGEASVVSKNDHRRRSPEPQPPVTSHLWSEAGPSEEAAFPTEAPGGFCFSPAQAAGHIQPLDLSGCDTDLCSRVLPSSFPDFSWPLGVHPRPAT